MRRGFVCLIVRCSAVAIGCAAYGQSNTTPEDPARRWAGLVETAQQQRQAGDYQAAFQTLQQASDLSRQTPGATQMRARSYEYLGSVAALLGRPTEAETMMKSSIRLWEESGEAGLVARLQAEADLLSLYVATGRPGPAARLARTLAASCDARLDQDAAAADKVYGALAAAAYLNQDLPRAEALSRKAIQFHKFNPSDMPEERSQVHNQLGLILWQQGRKDEARQEAQVAVDILEANRRVNVVEYASALSNLAKMKGADRNDPNALEMMHRAIEIVRSNIGPSHVFLVGLWSDYADLLKRAKRGEESKAARREAQNIYQRTLVQQPGRYSVDVADFTRDAGKR
ncbi:tetratricopeptide repeat protein [Paludibaculum fermentans]|uniref:tetratricopeptide repeat protein n=1 Tax=Paludibaculum fermentans TaxID=1473598 RepID=UPI003EB9D706